MKTAVLAVSALMFAGCAAPVATSGPSSPQSTKIEQAYESCEIKDYHEVGVGDEGHSLAMQWRPGITELMEEDFTCLLNSLDAPQSLLQKMSVTRPMDGIQEGSWGPYRASWSYSYEEGIRVIIEES